MNDDLKPCPFCGKPAVIEAVRGSEHWLAHCSDRLCGSILANSEARAAMRWNTRAAISAVEGDGWQPIDSAPKDGSIVWVADPHNLCVAYFTGNEEMRWRNWYKGNRYENVELGIDAYLPEPVWFEPTHWQPTPAPPPVSKGEKM